jgi:hypothetical protein
LHASIQSTTTPIGSKSPGDFAIIHLGRYWSQGGHARYVMNQP